MAALSYMIVVVLFVVYYLAVVISERKVMDEPREIIEKFLAFALLYAGVALIYFSFTGKPFLTDTIEEYYIYIFLIGFIALLWAIPNLLSEFKFFRNFVGKKKR